MILSPNRRTAMFDNAAHLLEFLHFACHPDRQSVLSEREHQTRAVTQTFQAAAVLIPFEWQAQQPKVWLTRRSGQLRHHGGQIAFPGGKCDAADGNSAVATALRETREELGVAAHAWDIVGQLRPCYLPSGFVVNPVVALRRLADPWQPNPDEVSEVFSVPLSLILEPRHYQTRHVRHGEHKLTVHSLPFADYDIWGATAGMLYHLAQSHQQWQQQDIAT